MKKKLIIAAVVLALLAWVLGIDWPIAGWPTAGMPPDHLVLTYGDSSSMGPTGRTVTIDGVEFVEISPGYFRMGSHNRCVKGDQFGRLCALMGLPWGKQLRHGWECPVHWVELPNGFWIARTEVTNQVYERFDPDYGRRWDSPGDDHPVTYVSWEDVRRFCTWLFERSGLPICLPSEAEWECACRAGSETEYCFGDDEQGLGEYGWSYSPHGLNPEVAILKPNAWGLHDLHGNVMEWCEDTWHDSYEGAPRDGSAWTSGGTPRRVTRGGSWGCHDFFCSSAFRWSSPPSLRGWDTGFRPAFSIVTDAEREALRRYMEKTRQGE